jgi:lipoprotein-releasing system ATP-binding protein
VDFLSRSSALPAPGKSTLLSILGGIDRPPSGRWSWKVQKSQRSAAKELGGCGGRHRFCLPIFLPCPYLTVYETSMVPLILDGKRTAAYENKRPLQLMDYLGIAAQKINFLLRFRAAKQQRAAIARGLIFDPEVNRSG